MSVVRISARVCETVVDIDVMASLRRRIGKAAFDEFFEDALCDVTERLCKVERAMARGAHGVAATEARALSALAGRLGLRSVRTAAAALQDCLRAGDMAAAHAVASRLSRLGERCVLAAAEVSVDLGATAT